MLYAQKCKHFLSTSIDISEMLLQTVIVDIYLMMTTECIKEWVKVLGSVQGMSMGECFAVKLNKMSTGHTV